MLPANYRTLEARFDGPIPAELLTDPVVERRDRYQGQARTFRWSLEQTRKSLFEYPDHEPLQRKFADELRCFKHFYRAYLKERIKLETEDRRRRNAVWFSHNGSARAA